MAPTQEEFFASLAKPAEDRPKAKTLKFPEMNVPQQGRVVEVYPTTERGFGPEPDPVDKNGNPKPMLIITVEQADGELGKIFYKGSLLYSLTRVIAEQGLKEVPVGAMIGSAWTSNKPFNGFQAKQYTTKLAVQE